MSYCRWARNDSVALTLTLAESDGSGATGATPEVRIQRMSDSYYWDGAAFVVGSTWLSMTEVDDTDQPGLYAYDFDHPGVEGLYRAYYRNTGTPNGFDVETHHVTAMLDPEVGASVVTLTMHDQDAAIVPGWVAGIFDSGGTVLLAQVTDTDSDGVVTLAINDGDYIVRATAPRFTADEAEAELTVDGDTAVTYEGTLLAAPAASDPALCAVWGNVLDATGAPIADADIGFYADTPQGVSSNLMLAKRQSATTDELGYFEVELVRGARVVVRCAAAKLDGLVITVPDEATASLAELVEAAV